MKAFHGDKELAEHRLAEARRHAELGMLIKGTYGQGIGKEFKGCPIGCLYGDPSTGKEGTHEHGEDLDGLPRELLRLVDDLFEALPEKRRNQWHVEWVQACAEACGADLSLVWHQYDYWIIHDPVDGVIASARQENDEELVNLIDQYEPLLQRAKTGDMPSDQEFLAAARDALASRDARDARDVWDAWAALAAWEVRGTGVIRVSRAAWVARRSGSVGADKQADKLLELIRAAKPSIE